ncbi:MAG: hypothetical protein ACXWIU_07310 [Limisphaerales bacterium]
MNVSKVESASQEAMETAAQTRAEAAKGDQQAVAKLARATAAKAPPKPPISEKGLDAKA